MVTTEQHRGWAGAFDEGRSRLVDLPEPAGDDRPAYVRIAEALGRAIDARVYRQGAQLPPAASIGHRYGVSVDTGRQAVKILIDAGLVVRMPGGGAYVKGRPAPQEGIR